MRSISESPANPARARRDRRPRARCRRSLDGARRAADDAALVSRARARSERSWPGSCARRSAACDARRITGDRVDPAHAARALLAARRLDPGEHARGELARSSCPGSASADSSCRKAAAARTRSSCRSRSKARSRGARGCGCSSRTLRTSTTRRPDFRSCWSPARRARRFLSRTVPTTPTTRLPQLTQVTLLAQKNAVTGDFAGTVLVEEDDPAPTLAVDAAHVTAAEGGVAHLDVPSVRSHGELGVLVDADPARGWPFPGTRYRRRGPGIPRAVRHHSPRSRGAAVGARSLARHRVSARRHRDDRGHPDPRPMASPNRPKASCCGWTDSRTRSCRSRSTSPGSFAERLVHECDRDRSLADRGSHPLDIARSHVAHGENARQARFQQERAP